MPIAPDPNTLHPVEGQSRVVFLKPLVTDPRIEVGEYTYYDDPDDALAFERTAFLYAYGPERLIIGRYCALASGVRFVMPGANHADLGPSTFPFGIFGEPWAERTMDLVMAAPSRGDTTVGHDVWLGYRALVMPGVTIGHGAVVAAAASSRRTSRRTRSPVGTRRGSSGSASATPMSSCCCAPPGGTGRSRPSPSTRGRSWRARPQSSRASPSRSGRRKTEPQDAGWLHRRAGRLTGRCVA